MMKRCAPRLLFVALLCSSLSTACRSAQAPNEVRGPAGPRVELDCGVEEERLTDPERKRTWLPRENCREHYVARLEAALSADPRIHTFDIRSGEIGAEEIPPSDEWEMGASPEWADSPGYVIPVRFDEPLRWEPYIVTWFPEVERTFTSGRSSLIIAKEKPTPEGFEIHLVALGETRVYEISVAWVAFDTTQARR